MNNFIILCGHYGCGKTNIAMNLAVHLAAKGKKLIFVDLDLVDQFYNSTDNAKILEENGIEIVASETTGSNLDIPVLPPNLYSIFSQNEKDVIIDVGADENGARILGRFYREISKKSYQMLFIINYYRVFLNSMENVIALAKKIERASRLELTGIINNSNLYNKTTVKEVLDSLIYAKKVSKELDLPITMTTVPVKIAPKLIGSIKNVYPIENYMANSWDKTFV